jgi:hypothetical protein
MMFFIVCIADSLVLSRISNSVSRKFLIRPCFSRFPVRIFFYARVFLSAVRALTLSSDSKCALGLEILHNSFSEARINAVAFESACFFGTFPKFARPESEIAHPRSRLRNTNFPVWMPTNKS